MSKPAFIFRDEHEFTWPVTVRYPGDGKIIEAEFEGRFVTLPEDELVNSAIQPDPDETPQQTFARMIEADREKCLKVLRGWNGVSTEDGAELPFSDENAERLLSNRHVRVAIGRAYSEAMLDREDTRTGN